jgi:hypothetical protein
VGEVGQNVGKELEGKGRGEDGQRRRHPFRPPVVTELERPSWRAAEKGSALAPLWWFLGGGEEWCEEE